MNIRPGGAAGAGLAYAVGSFSDIDDSFVVTQLGGESPFGSVLVSLGSDYAVHISPDGAGRSTFAGLDVTTPLGNGKGWYIRDCESGQVWSPFFMPVCERFDEHQVLFLPGRVTAQTLKNKIASTITIATLPGRPIEIWLIRLENRSAAERCLTFTTYIEPSIGPGLETSYKERERLLMMRRPLASVGGEDELYGGDLVLFHSSTLTPIRYQTEKSEFIGDGRTLRNPRELDGGGEPASDGPAARAIASFTVKIELPIEGEAEFAFVFGVARSPQQALDLARGLSKTKLVVEAVEAARVRWEELCSTIHIETPDRAFNALVNTWLPYEAYAGWIRHRTGGVCLDPLFVADTIRRLYPLCATARIDCRESLLTFAAGVSTAGTYSPDNESVMMLPPEELVWLPACAARYVVETGDLSVLGQSVGSGDGPSLTLEEHCERILRLCAASSDTSSNPLVRWTLDAWSAATGQKLSYKEALNRAVGHDLTDESGNQDLPRRLRHYQHISPTLSEPDTKSELALAFSSKNSPEVDSKVACLVYSAAVEHILGIRATCDGLQLRPRLPESWNECRIRRKFRGDIYDIHITRPATLVTGGVTIKVDGDSVFGQNVPHFGDGAEHRVEVVLD